MKWNIATTALSYKTMVASCINFDDIEQGVNYLLDLYQQIGWLEDVTADDITNQIAAARATERRIISEGLNPKPHGRYRLFMIPNSTKWPLLHPTKMRPILRDLLGKSDYKGWGWINREYYGTPDAPKTTLVVNNKEQPIDHGFTADDVGKIGFLVEDKFAPGHNPVMPGSLLSDMAWDEKRLKLGADWQAQYPNTKPRFVNYAIKGLLNLGDITNWDDAFGRTGYTDFISQLFDAKRDLCSCGGLYDCGAGWDADGGGADSRYAAAAVVW